MPISEKYLALRKRFFDKFFFEGMVAEWIEPDEAGKEHEVKFADQTIAQGMALMVLASEMPLFKKQNRDTADTINQIKTILAAINLLDHDAEPQFGEPATDPNGYVMRDNITGPMDPRLKNRFAKCQSDYQKLEDNSPSLDQIIGLMYGLLFVVHFEVDPEVVKTAKEISGRLFEYVKRSNFDLKLPNGTDKCKRGHDARPISSLIHGLNLSITGEDHFNQCRFVVSTAEFNLPGNIKQSFSLMPVAAFWDSSESAAAIRALTNRPNDRAEVVITIKIVPLPKILAASRA